MPLFELVACDRISDRYCEENNRSKNHKQIVHFQHLSNSAIHRRFIVVSSCRSLVAGLQLPWKELQARF
jgi:hypothetical protein